MFVIVDALTDADNVVAELIIGLVLIGILPVADVVMLIRRRRQ